MTGFAGHRSIIHLTFRFFTVLLLLKNIKYHHLAANQMAYKNHVLEFHLQMKSYTVPLHLSMLHICFFFLLLQPVRSSGQNFSTILIFGDSTVDTGNNNYITTAIKANHYPYGKDFPTHSPTGRFSNGRLSVDFLASMLGVKQSVPPFLRPGLSAHELLTGVSFASAGTGYDILTAAITRVLPMSKQLDYFRSYRERLKKIVGEKEAERIINHALVCVSAGTNDFIFNFYDIPIRQVEFNIHKYQDFILERLHDFVKELYKLGCRTMVIAGLPPIGCLPIQITAKFKEQLDRKCVVQQNVDARAYNKKLLELLFHTQMSLKGSRIYYVDIYKPIIDMIRRPEIYGACVHSKSGDFDTVIKGPIWVVMSIVPNQEHPAKFGMDFSETVKGCCGTGLLEAGPICTPLTPLCRNSSEYLFFDSIHPSEKAYRYVTECLVKQIFEKL